MFPKVEAFLIRCTTGCTCCRNENELRGPWRSLEAAQAQAENYARWPLLSSQYAPRGHYQILLVDAEALPDGRLILANRLIAPAFIGENEAFDDALLRGEEIELISGKPAAAPTT